MLILKCDESSVDRDTKRSILALPCRFASFHVHVHVDVRAPKFVHEYFAFATEVWGRGAFFFFVGTLAMAQVTKTNLIIAW